VRTLKTGVAIFFSTLAIAGIILLFTTPIEESEEVELMALKTEKIILGENVYSKAEEISMISFLANHYEKVMVWPKDGKVHYLGKANDYWFSAKENLLSASNLSKINTAKLENTTLSIGYTRNYREIFFFTFFLIAFLLFLLVVIFD